MKDRFNTKWVWPVLLLVSVIVSTLAVSTLGLHAGRTSAVVITESPAPGASTTARIDALESFGHLPMSFEPNHGQFDPRVKFASRGAGHTLFLTDRAAALSFGLPADKAGRVTSAAEGQTGRRRLVLQLALEGSNQVPRMVAEDELPGVANYYLGSDPQNWHTGVPTYASIRYQNVYPGIDLKYYGNQRQLETDFVVAPGADPDRIRLRFEGGAGLYFDSHGDLVLKTEAGRFVLRKPAAYQGSGKNKNDVDARYVLHQRSRLAGESWLVGIKLASYDHRAALTIDPALVYSTYLGGTLAQGNAVAIDSLGEAFIAGSACTGDFPVTIGPAFVGNPCDAFVSKLNASGTKLVYSTLIGGNGLDVGTAIAIDSGSNAYAAGITFSSNFPFSVGLAYGGKGDAWAAKFGPAGKVVWATLLGGSAFDAAYAIALNPACALNCNAYVTGETSSTNFAPITGGVFQATSAGSSDAFVVKLNANGTAGTAPSYGTYLGGSGRDSGRAVVVDPAGAAYVAGVTASGDFPTTVGPKFAGGSDAFVAKVSATGAAKSYSTLLGGGGYDSASAIAIKRGCKTNCNAYVAGSTFSPDFPTTPGAFQTVLDGRPDGFVTQLSADGLQRVYSTLIGRTGENPANDLVVDPLGRADLTGSSSSTDFPLASPLRGVSVQNGIVYKSANGFFSFSQSGPPSSVGSLTGMAFDSSVSPPAMYVATSRDGVLKSLDEGVTFTPTVLGSTVTDAIAVDNSVKPSIIYVGTPDGLVSLTGGGGVLGGTSLNGSQVFAVLVDQATKPSTILVGTNHGLFQSINGGASFTKTTGIPSNVWVFAVAAAGKTVVIGTNRGLFVSSDLGVTALPSPLKFAPVLSVAVDKKTVPPTFYAGLAYGHGVARSNNGFASFTFPTLPKFLPTVNSLAIDTSKTPSTIYAGVASLGLSDLFVSTNGGAAFSPTTMVDQPGSINVVGVEAGGSHLAFAGVFLEVDAWVAQLNPTGSGLSFSTYLGGTSVDSGTGIAVTSNGCKMFVTGSTFSHDFPIKPDPGAERTTLGFEDAFVSQISLCVTPTATRTRTATPTATHSKTTTATPRKTATRTSTATASHTAARTSTRTPTPSPTKSTTRTPTRTPTATATK